jgi:acetylornithine deacetylase/succinyl-diaminopimelate desuccinylase-like protein
VDTEMLRQWIEKFWDKEILPSLSRYIEIPNKSPVFDPNWQHHGHMDRAIDHVMDWIDGQQVPGLIMSRQQLPGRTPLLYLDLPATPHADKGCILIYGHLDKQPEFTGWRTGLGPFKPVLENDRLYGRGGADDGYAVYAMIAAIKALAQQGLAMPRMIGIIECSEESGSPDLAGYMASLAGQLDDTDLVIALDSSCGNYDQLWLTTSLRGMLIGELRVDVLNEGAHSGAAGGIVPSSFRILRQLLSRLEDETSGAITPSFLNEQIPDFRRAEAAAAGAVLADSFGEMYSFAGAGVPLSSDPTELVINNTWQAALEVTGMDGLPTLAAAGNVLRPFSSAKLARRLPPTTDATRAAAQLHTLLTEDPPHGSRVTFEFDTPASGWHAPAISTDLNASLQEASRTFFGAPAIAMGCGGSIPFMEYLARTLPDAQFLVTGVLGPHSNAHGPNEFLHVPTASKITACIASVMHDWATGGGERP